MSEATKDALKGAYDTEPGNGGERDPYLEKAGTTTYLIVEKVHFPLIVYYHELQCFVESRYYRKG